MTQSEEKYLDLVGEEGHDKAKRSVNVLLTPLDGSGRELFFATLLNAYWRGKNDGICEARAIIAERRFLNSGKPTN